MSRRRAPKIGFVSLGCPKALVDSERILTQLRAEGYEVAPSYDAADVAHMILKCHDRIDWRKLLDHMELYWEVLLMALLNFRFVYPSERDVIPGWLMDDLLGRLSDQSAMKPPGKRVCRGRIFSPRDYSIDVDQWGFSEAVGNLEEQYGKD